MDKELADRFIATVPGAKRAAQGIVLPLGNGEFLHVRNVIDSKEIEGLSSEESFFIEFCSKAEIVRLRELRGAHDYLLRLRANAIVDSPRAVRVMIARRKKFENTGRPWALSHYYHSKDHHHKSYTSLLARPKAKKLKSVPSGLAFIDEANALCIRSLAGDVVVAAESLEHFYYFMSIAFYGGEFDIPQIDRADALLIAIRIMNGAEALDFDIDPRGTLPPSTERKLKELVSSQMQFTFGHEYAHLLCKHLSRPDALDDRVSIKTNIGYLKELRVYNHELEFEADLCSLKNIYHNKQAFPVIAHGAFSVLLYLHFLEQVKGPFSLKPVSVSLTHPSPQQRIHRLHRGLGKKSPISEDIITNMLAASSELESALKYRTEGQRKDILTFYGSLYLSSYLPKLKQDRYDF